MVIKYGSTRTVFLIGKYAFKVPSFKQWNLFLWGLLANRQEKLFSGVFDGLCPVLLYVPGGFLVVMPRCTSLDYTTFIETGTDVWLKERGLENICEGKLDCFGVLEGNLVVVDYGNLNK